MEASARVGVTNRGADRRGGGWISTSCKFGVEGGCIAAIAMKLGDDEEINARVRRVQILSLKYIVPGD